MFNCSFGDSVSNCNIYFSGNNYSTIYSVARQLTFINSYNYNGSVLNIPPWFGYLSSMFSDCHNFNGRVTFSSDFFNSNTTRSVLSMFKNCYNFNQALNFPATFYLFNFAFANCYNFNSSVTMQDKELSIVTRRSYIRMFENCYNFNNLITLNYTNSNCYYMFESCYNFNQSLNISNASNILGMLANCNNFNSPIYIRSMDSNSSSYLTFRYTYLFGGYLPNRFNAPIEICRGNSPYNQVTMDVSYFLNGGYNFNSDVVFSGDKNKNINAGSRSAGINIDGFFFTCYNFNRDLNLGYTTLGRPFYINSRWQYLNLNDTDMTYRSINVQNLYVYNVWENRYAGLSYGFGWDFQDMEESFGYTIISGRNKFRDIVNIYTDTYESAINIPNCLAGWLSRYNIYTDEDPFAKNDKGYPIHAHGAWVYDGYIYVKTQLSTNNNNNPPQFQTYIYYGG